MCAYHLYPNLLLPKESADTVETIVNYLNQHVTPALLVDYDEFLVDLDVKETFYNLGELGIVRDPDNSIQLPKSQCLIRSELFRWEHNGDYIKVDLPRLYEVGCKPTYISLYQSKEYIGQILMKNGVPRHYCDIMVEDYAGDGSHESYFFDSYHYDKYYYIQNCVIDLQNRTGGAGSYITWFSYFANQLNPEIGLNYFKLRSEN